MFKLERKTAVLKIK